MGYYTDYIVKFDADEDKMDLIADQLSNIAGYKFYDEGGALTLNTAKWYDNEKDMKGLSAMHPDILFTVYGNGEESDDMWVAYYLNGVGKSAKAKIVYTTAAELGI